VKVLQKQLGMAMKQMIEHTGAELKQKMETLRQIINFSLAMLEDDKTKKDSYDKLLQIRSAMSLHVKNEYYDSFEDPDVILSKDEVLFRLQLEDIHGEVSFIITKETLLPPTYLDEIPGMKPYAVQAES
jgi:hypothetical protein